MGEDNASREIINYEYRLENTPRYIQDVDDTWELVDVKYIYLPGGGFNLVAVFRKPMKKQQEATL